MRILAVDTSTMVSSISLLEDDSILASYALNQEKTHAELLMPMIGQLLQGLGLKLKDIDAFVVGLGPGSFTGLRIGVSAVKTIAQVLDKPVIGISSLKALAANVLSDKLIMPMVDARGKRSFIAIYKWEDGELKTVLEDCLVGYDKLVEILENSGHIVLIGDGINRFREDFESFDNVSFADSNLNNSISPSLACLGRDRYRDKDFDDYYDLLPNYIRKSQAELDFGKNKKSK